MISPYTDEIVRTIQINFQFGLCKTVLSDMFGLTNSEIDRILEGYTQGEMQR